MTEISKELKIMLIVDVITAFIYGFLFMIIPEVVYVLRNYPHFAPQFWRLWGGTCFAMGIFCLIAVKRAEWENIKIFLEFGILWLIFAIVVNMLAFTIVIYSATALLNQWVDNILIIVLIIANSYFYIRENK
ncbi:MAG: hypothetical protein HWN67_13040 [Candidatus Helarchaeota archaeon]|nr:hypothetical protein [Candidatus Helarchaeota archaeon]